MTPPRSFWKEVLAFCAVALLLALANSFLNPSAMALGTNYFPGSAADPSQAESGNGGSSLVPGKPQHEFQVADLEEMKADMAFFSEPEGDILCLDARDPELYRKGHIPGSLLLDHYHKDKYLPELLPRLQNAAMIIIYCAGGDCEDSIFLARSLMYEYEIDKEVLWIYEGGMLEWEAEGMELTEGSTP